MNHLFFLPGHPRFLNQLSQGLDIISMAGEWLAATANTNMFTYEIAPVFLMMENEVCNLLFKLFLQISESQNFFYNFDCSDLLEMRNLQEQVKKAFCYQKLF